MSNLAESKGQRSGARPTPKLTDDMTEQTLRPDIDASEASDGKSPHGDERLITEQTRRLQALVDLFIAIMLADQRSDKQVQLAQDFNRLLDAFLDQYETESTGTFAYRIAEMGIPYSEAFQDLMYVRGLQASPEA